MNKVIFIGNLGRDPELNYLPSGTAVCKFSIAVNNRRKSKDGEAQNETMWLNIVAWTKLAETCSTFLKKGSKVCVEGRLVINNYTNKEGEKRTSVEVHLSEMEMLDSKREENSQSSSQSNDEELEEHPF